MSYKVFYDDTVGSLEITCTVYNLEYKHSGGKPKCPVCKSIVKNKEYCYIIAYGGKYIGLHESCFIATIDAMNMALVNRRNGIVVRCEDKNNELSEL